MLHKLSKVTKKNKKRVGRGYGSGKGGHTAGRGMKGAKSRSGYKLPRPGFEGGQMPLSRRLPKLKGFSRGYFAQKVKAIALGLDDLASFSKGETVTMEKLHELGIISGKSKQIHVKILNNGELNHPVNIEGIEVSKTAKEAIEAAGGSVS